MIATLLLLLQVPTYEDAVAKANKDGSAVVVIIGAEYCPPCKVFKSEIAKWEKIDRASIVYVDAEKQPDLAKKLMAGRETLPQVIVYAKNSDGWRRSTAIGPQTRSRILEMINRVWQRF